VSESGPPEITLAGYMRRHERAAAFAGSDGRAYSCAIYCDGPDAAGRFEASLLFIEWDQSGSEPVGHVETPVVASGRSREEAEARVGVLSLYDVKAALDRAIEARVLAW
jgi:hypothetical protein